MKESVIRSIKTLDTRVLMGSTGDSVGWCSMILKQTP